MTPPLPITRDLTLAYLSSSVIAVGIGVASVAGLVSGAEGVHGESSLVLVSQGADAANLVLVLPILLGAMGLAMVRSLPGLLFWPGALFYTLYAYVPYLVGAPLSWLFLVYAGLVVLSAFSVIGIVASIDGHAVTRRLAATPARGVGAVLVVIAVAAFVGLTATMLTALGGPAGEAHTRPLAVADWAIGTPALLAGGVLLLLRASLGYVVAAGLLLVSGLGGAVFVFAAVVDNLASGPQTEAAVIAVHLVISAVSFAVLGWFLRAARKGQPLNATRRDGSFPVLPGTHRS